MVCTQNRRNWRAASKIIEIEGLQGGDLKNFCSFQRMSHFYKGSFHLINFFLSYGSGDDGKKANDKSCQAKLAIVM